MDKVFRFVEKYQIIYISTFLQFFFNKLNSPFRLGAIVFSAVKYLLGNGVSAIIQPVSRSHAVRPDGVHRVHQVGEKKLMRSKPRKIIRSEEHTSELQSRGQLVCRLLLQEK